MASHLSRRCRHRRHLHRHRAARLRRHASTPRRSRRASRTTPRRSSTAWPSCSRETGLSAARDRGDPPRHHGRLQRDPRAQGRARRADHHQGLSRRARDPHPADAAALRPRPGPSRRRWSSATCARWSTSGSTTAARIERALDPADAERAVDALLAEKVEAIAVCLLNSFANPAHELMLKEIVAAQGAAPAAEHLVRGAAGDQGIRAHLDHRHQRLRDADRRDLSARAARRARRGRHSGAPAADAVERRADDRHGRGRAADEHHRIRPGRRRGRRAGAGAREAARRRSSPSTWAAPPPRPRWSRTAR